MDLDGKSPAGQVNMFPLRSIHGFREHLPPLPQHLQTMQLMERGDSMNAALTLILAENDPPLGIKRAFHGWLCVEERSEYSSCSEKVTRVVEMVEREGQIVSV